METELIAFIDESKKPMRDRRTRRVDASGDHYVAAAGVVLAGDIDAIRVEVAKLESELGFGLHYSDLSRPRRRQAAEAIASIEGWDGFLFETARPLSPRHNSEHRVRAKVVGAAFEVLGGDLGVTHVTLETRNHPGRGLDQLDQKDHQVLQSLLAKQLVPQGFRISHADKSESVLAIADIVAGARTDYLCGVDVEPFGALTHMVRPGATVLER